ncbi:MAG: hypothetical protein FJW20_24640 [Acidimicrobiia bacterium]|nr:hypothetical protein [Acidimicrobiia bacterium]
MPQSKRVTSLAFLVILCMSGFLFSRTDGNQPVWGDDIFFLDYMGLGEEGYLVTAAHRGFLAYFYHALHSLLGRDPQKTHLFFFFLLVASGLLFYLTLNQFLEARASLAGALFYLAYFGKVETVAWLSAGGYLVLAIVFLLSVFIALRWADKPWMAAITITILNWLAVHLYELLIVAAPLYPILVFAHGRLQRTPASARRIVASCLPLAMFLVHWR